MTEATDIANLTLRVVTEMRDELRADLLDLKHRMTSLEAALDPSEPLIEAIHAGALDRHVLPNPAKLLGDQSLALLELVDPAAP